MSNENKKNKPDCPLVGQDGNIYSLVGIASKTLKRMVKLSTMKRKRKL